MNHNRKESNKPKLVFALLIIICAGLIVLSLRSGSTGTGILSIVLSPMESGINSVGGLVSSITQKKETIDSLKSENQELQDQVEQLKSQVSALQQNLNDYDDLLSLTQLTEKYPGYEMTGARIIGKDTGNWYTTFTINKGSRDGIKVDMNVIADDGLVGIVTQVDVTSSVVRTIIDDTSSVSAMISKNYDNCIVEGDLTLISNGLLNVDMISDDTSVVDGDEVVTSYVSDKYLPGILIGYISNIQADDTNLNYHGELTPVVDFQHLSSVMVIKTLKTELDAQQYQDTSTQTNDSSDSTADLTETDQETAVETKESQAAPEEKTGETSELMETSEIAETSQAAETSELSGEKQE